MTTNALQPLIAVARGIGALVLAFAPALAKVGPLIGLTVVMIGAYAVYTRWAV